MKLTKDMFDFEKYDYFDELKPEMEKGAEWFGYSGHWAPLTRHIIGLCRKLKPPPRYILLNEGEKLQAGDEVFFNSTKDWCLYSTITREVLPGEVWRRKDTTK